MPTTDDNNYATEKVITRDEARAAIFATRKPKVKVISFFGVDIEIRQPILNDILAASAEEKDEQGAMIRTLVRYAYVPGTDIKLFTAEDEEAFRAQPFGGDFVRVAEAFQELTDANFLDGRSGSKATTS